jgi:hypothetical protein
VPRETQSRQVALARVILGKIVAEAQINSRRLSKASATKGQPAQLTGDELTAQYIRQAARAADGVGIDDAPRAFLIAIGIGLDDSNMLRTNPLVRELCRAVETDEERAERLAVLRQPTLLGRRDLAQHFAVSAFLTAAFSVDVAETAGIAKEILDARMGSGFSFADLAADYAGIMLGKQVLAKELTLLDLSGNFVVPDYMPSIAELAEGLDWETFEARFGSVSDNRFLRARTLILSRIAQLPAYRRSAG